jgi:hypothetical protein
MLERTAHEAFQESQETGIGRIIRTFDPDVSGLRFLANHLRSGWGLRASGASRLLSVRSCHRCLHRANHGGHSLLGSLPCAAILRQQWHRSCEFRQCQTAFEPQ